MQIILYEGPPPEKRRYESASNIVAVDSFGRLIWKAQDPKTHYDKYWYIEINTDGNTLIAMSAGGLRHIIDLETGKILDNKIIK